MNRFERYYDKEVKNRKTRTLIADEIHNLELGIQIAKLREQSNLNQTELAARAGLHASKISRIETSTANVTLSTLMRLASALNQRIKIQFVPLKRRRRA